MRCDTYHICINKYIRKMFFFFHKSEAKQGILLRSFVRLALTVVAPVTGI